MPRRLFLLFFALFLAAPSRAQTPEKNAPKTLVLALGGVNWADWSQIAASQPADPKTAFPNLHRVLNEGILGAARLEGGPGVENWPNFSPGLARAAFSLSSGRDFAGNLPPESAWAVGPNEVFPGESGPSVGAFVRRLGRVPKSGELWNPAWPLVTREANGGGRLAETLRAANARAVAIGNGDWGFETGQKAREWALLATDSNGIIGGGSLGPNLLRRDGQSPFGVRAAHIPTVLAVLAALQSPDVRLIALEWGDTRRAAQYEPFCTLPQAQRFRFLALKRADFLLKALLPHLRDQDRLIVVAIPDLGAAAQTLPLAIWQHGGRGGILATARGEGFLTAGEFGLRLQNADFSAQNGPNAAARVQNMTARLAAQGWLENARMTFQSVWLALFGLAMVVSLTGQKRRRWPLVAKILWAAALVWPVFGFLIGACLEMMRRNAPGSSVFFAGLGVGVILAVRAWFGARLRRELVGVSWLGLTLAGWSLGAFALPENALFRVENFDLWHFWLVGATLLGVAGLVETEGGIKNPRPATLWLLAVGIGLWWSGAAALAAGAAFGFLLFKIWPTRLESGHFLKRTRGIWRGFVVAGFLTWAALHFEFSAQWRQPFWLCAFGILMSAASLFLAIERTKRASFAARSSVQAATFGSLVAAPFFGPAAILALLLFPLAGLMWEARDG